MNNSEPQVTDEATVQALTVQALRESAADLEPNGGQLTDLLSTYDQMKADGKDVLLHINTETMTISVVEREEVTVDLGEIAAEALREVDEEMAAEAANGVTPVFLDEPEDA